MATGADGLMEQLPYLRAGDGPTIVLVHGYLGGAEQWSEEMAHLSDRFDVIAPNLPGFGAASHFRGCDTINAMASAVFQLIDSLEIENFFLLGHSMGGMIVQEMSRIQPQRISRLVLYGTGPLGLMPDRFEPIETSRKRLLSDGVEQTIRRIGATWFRDGDKANGYPLVAKIGKNANRQAAEAALGAMAQWDGREALTNLTMPTLIIWGDSDRSYRWPQVQTLWMNIPDVRLSVVPGTAHAAHLEKPKLFHGLLDDFLDEQSK